MTHSTLEAEHLRSDAAHINQAPTTFDRSGINGTSNSIVRRLRDPNFISRYFYGHGIDIGCEPHNSLFNFIDFFPLMDSVTSWNIEDGDAQYMQGTASNSYDFVHSSHCLEHINDPFQAMKNWLRILRPRGHIVVIVPDEDMYEQGVWPSQFNGDHKHSFTPFKRKSWCPASVNVIDLLSSLNNVDIIKIERLTATFRTDGPKRDQTTSNIGEPSIEFIVRKLQ